MKTGAEHATKNLSKFMVYQSGLASRLKVSTGWNSPPEEKIGLITKINWDTVNVLSGMNTRSDFAESSLDVHVMVGNETMLLKDLNETFNTIGKNGTSYRWSGAKFIRSDYPLSYPSTPRMDYILQGKL